MEKEIVRFFARAEGRVQGVGFRFFVQQNAAELGLCGWVRSMEDGGAGRCQGGRGPVEQDLAGQRLHPRERLGDTGTGTVIG